jgi:hypothetical protein
MEMVVIIIVVIVASLLLLQQRVADEFLACTTAPRLAVDRFIPGFVPKNSR